MKRAARVTYETVRRLGLTLPHANEGTSYGTPALKVKGKLFARLREDPDSLVIRMPLEQREVLMAEAPEIYYITDHYRDYEYMLVRLSKVHPDALRDLLRGSYQDALAEKRRRQAGRTLDGLILFALPLFLAAFIIPIAIRRGYPLIGVLVVLGLSAPFYFYFFVFWRLRKQDQYPFQPRPELRVTRREKQGLTVLDVDGRLTLSSVGTFRLEMGAILEGDNPVLLNLEKLSYIDASGLGELLRLVAPARARSGALKLIQPSEKVRKQLEAMRAAAAFEIYPDEDQAIASFHR